MEAQIPEGFYYFIGFLIVTNIGAFGAAVTLIVKVSFKFGGILEKLDRNIQDTNAAHQKIREMKKPRGE